MPPNVFHGIQGNDEEEAKKDESEDEVEAEEDGEYSDEGDYEQVTSKTKDVLGPWPTYVTFILFVDLHSN